MKSSIQSIVLFCLMAGAMLTQLGAGCSSTPTNDDNRGDNRSDNRYTTASIPDDANVVDEGTGRITYTARRDGRVYLYDLDDRVVLDSRSLRRDQQYAVMPDDN